MPNTKEYNRAYYLKHKAQIRVKRSARRTEVNAYQRAWYAKNRDRVRKQRRAKGKTTK